MASMIAQAKVLPPIVCMDEKVNAALSMETQVSGGEYGAVCIGRKMVPVCFHNHINDDSDIQLVIFCAFIYETVSKHLVRNC